MLKAFSIIVLMLALLFSYQNCAVYQSEGKEELNKFLSGSFNGCLPFLDINDAASITGYSTNDISLNRTGDSSSNFGCTISNRGSGSDRGSILCQVGDDEKTMAQLSYQPTESFDDIYNAYCSNGNFACEDVGEHRRVGIHSYLIASATGSTDFLAYFKMNLTDDGRFSTNPSEEEYNYSGFGYARFDAYITTAKVYVTDDVHGVECQISFPRRVSDGNINILSARQADYNEIVGSSPSDLNKLKNLSIRILSNL